MDVLFIIAVGCFLLSIAFQHFKEKKRWRRGRNFPLPAPKRQRRLKGVDSVIDENGEVVSLPEYNLDRGTDFTLDDIYGKGYYDRLPDPQKRYVECSKVDARVETQEGMVYTPHAMAADLLARGLVLGDFEMFSERLADDVELYLYGKEKIVGRAQVLDYWRRYSERAVQSRAVKKMRIRQCRYYVYPILEIAMFRVFFRFNDEGKLAMMFFAPRNIDKDRLGTDAWFDRLPPALDSVKGGFHDLPKNPTGESPEEDGGATGDAFRNRAPCMRCGCPSEDLEWHGYTFREERYHIVGEMSVCPHCGKVVEFLPRRREEQQKQD